MPNPNFWRVLDKIGHIQRLIADEAWKILRWLTFASAAFVGAQVAGIWWLQIIGIILMAFGALHLSGWLMDLHLRGITDKGRASGPVFSIVIATTAFVLSLVFAAVICVMIVSLLLPLAAG